MKVAKKYLFAAWIDGVEYQLDAYMPPEMAEKMQNADLVRISLLGELGYSIPAWVWESGLGPIWTFFADLLSFKSPFRK